MSFNQLVEPLVAKFAEDLQALVSRAVVLAVDAALRPVARTGIQAAAAPTGRRNRSKRGNAFRAHKGPRSAKAGTGSRGRQNRFTPR